MNKPIFLSKFSVPNILSVKQTVIGKALLLVSLLLLFNLSYSRGGEIYYKDFEDDNYEPFVEHNELLGDLIGLKNIHTGKVILRAEYDDIVSINEKYVRVIKNKKWGIVDTIGKVIIPLDYVSCSDMYNGRVFLENWANKIAVASSNGTLLTKFIYEDWGYHVDGLAPVKLKGLWGFINRQCVVVIPIKYVEVGRPTFGKIKVATPIYETVVLGTTQQANKPWTERVNDVTYKAKKHSIINYQGKTIFTSEDNIHLLEDGKILTASRKAGCSGGGSGWHGTWEDIALYDKSLKRIISYNDCWGIYEMDNISLFRNGKNGKIGYALNDNLIIPETPYVKYVDMDSEYGKPFFIKLVKESGDFTFLRSDGECIEKEGSKCD